MKKYYLLAFFLGAEPAAALAVLGPRGPLWAEHLMSALSVGVVVALAGAWLLWQLQGRRWCLGATLGAAAASAAALQAAALSPAFYGLLRSAPLWPAPNLKAVLPILPPCALYGAFCAV